MNKERFEKLAELRIKQREIEAEIDEIYPEITASVVDLEDGTIIETAEGNFSVSHRRSWTYSDEVESIAESLKKQKKLEEQKGIATYTTKPSVIFKESGNKSSNE